MIGEADLLLLLLLVIVPLNVNLGETNMESVTNKASIIADPTKYFFNLKRLLEWLFINNSN
jgi:predicted cation transporter